MAEGTLHITTILSFPFLYSSPKYIMEAYWQIIEDGRGGDGKMEEEGGGESEREKIGGRKN